MYQLCVAIVVVIGFVFVREVWLTLRSWTR